MEASASIVLKAGIDCSEHGLHGLLSVGSGQSVVHLFGSLRSKSLKNLFQNYTNPLRRGQSPAEMPFLHSINFGRCPIVVRSLSSCCPVNDWTTTGQQLDNERTTTEDSLVTHW